MRSSRAPFVPFLLLCAALAAPAAHAGPSEESRAENAVRVLTEIMQAPDKGIPEDLLRKAEAVVVVPDLVKAGFVLGGSRGKGLMAVRAPDGTWTNPSFVTMTGGSVGFQAGVQGIDVVLVFRTRRGADSVVNGKFTLGADASVAAGPVGRSASALTDAQLKAEIYAWSRARGLFAGIALDGSVLAIDHEANQAVYGADMTPRRIFAGAVENVPGPVVVFRDALEEHSAK